MTETTTESEQSPTKTLLIVFMVAILPVLIGLYTAPKLITEPKIGIIRLTYDIDSYTAYEIGAQLTYARQHDDIQGVVVIMNSPGGTASHSEELFMDILHTRQSLPVIASVDLVAASGAYYMAAAANEIYAKPTSYIGSIGVIASLPDGVFIEEDILTTGPYKAFGGTRITNIEQIETAKFAFLEAVQIGRGDRLQVTPEFLSRAEVYSGIQAKSYGLIDGLAATDEAIARAAELAGLRNYQTVELFDLTFPTATTTDDTTTYQPTIPHLVQPNTLWQKPYLAPGLYYRYLGTPVES
ncbi:MAG TPA: S49 family peptidase [Anaerolineae bacterium]|nr:S49 family peptidase [Anaerolineae bacterium]